MNRHNFKHLTFLEALSAVLMPRLRVFYFLHLPILPSSLLFFFVYIYIIIIFSLFVYWDLWEQANYLMI